MHSRQVALCTHSRQTRVLVQLEVKLQNADPPTIEVTAIFFLGCLEAYRVTEICNYIQVRTDFENDYFIAVRGTSFDALFSVHVTV